MAFRVNLFGILLQVFKGRPEYRASPLYNLFFLTNQNGIPSALAKVINSAGMSCQIGEEPDQIGGKDSTPLDAVLLDLSSMEQIDARHIVEKCRDRKLPVVLAVPRDIIADYDQSIISEDLTGNNSIPGFEVDAESFIATDEQHHSVFENIKMWLTGVDDGQGGGLHTNYYDDFGTWTHYWVTWSATGR